MGRMALGSDLFYSGCLHSADTVCSVVYRLSVGTRIRELRCPRPSLIFGLFRPMNAPTENFTEKLCINCKHYRVNRTWNVAVCMRRASIIDPVAADVNNYAINKAARCSLERTSWGIFAILFGECGSAGRFWEKKE